MKREFKKDTEYEFHLSYPLANPLIIFVKEGKIEYCGYQIPVEKEFVIQGEPSASLFAWTDGVFLINREPEVICSLREEAERSTSIQVGSLADALSFERKKALSRLQIGPKVGVLFFLRRFFF
jgi:N-terminal beta-sandwich domain of polyadenylation factor